MKKAIVTGVYGQDGSYMAELLLNKGYEVHGTISGKNKNSSNIKNIEKDLIIHEINLNQVENLFYLIQRFMPNEIYNFAAQSNSVLSWKDISYTYDINFQAVKNIAEFIHHNNLNIKLFNANSSEIFGLNPSDVPQNEKTAICPFSPYAVAKAMSFYMLKQYRTLYEEFFISGIFYNHESERRSEGFLSKKISNTVADIILGKNQILEIGNLEAQRDWGYAPDYMEAVWQIMQEHKADDYIISTGILYTVKEFIETAFMIFNKKLLWIEHKGQTIGLDSLTKNVLVKTNKNLTRNNDYTHLVGDNSKIYKFIGWKPKTSFEDMIKTMVETSIKEKKEWN